MPTPITHKPIGVYLVEAGLLSEAQVDVALADQSYSAMPFGEIIVSRGWLKEQTIEYLMSKIINPEREAEDFQAQSLLAGLARQTVKHPQVKMTQPLNAPSSRASSTTKDAEDGINWIG